MVALVAVIIIGALCLLILIISSMQPRKNNNISPVSNPVSNSQIDTTIDPNINLNPLDTVEYNIAIVSADDTVELRNNLNDIIVIGLQRKSWLDIKWAPDKKKVAVLSNENAGFADLYIFNTDLKKWTQATDFSTASNGIDSYFWIDSDTILFTQGEQPDHWIHRYKNSSGEVLKLQKVDGKIVHAEANRDNIILQSSDDTFTLYNTNGELMTEFINLSDSANSGISLKIEEIIQSDDLNKFGILDQSGKFYKYAIDTAKAIEVKNASGVTPVCSLNEDVFIGYEYNQSNNFLAVVTVNTKQNLKKAISEQTFADLNIEKAEVKCVSEDRIIIKSNSESGERWFINLDNDIIELVQGKGAGDVDIN